MSSLSFSILFVIFLSATLIVRLWLASRQIRHVSAHRHAVPDQFKEKISLVAHQKAANYTIAKTRFGIIELFINTALLIGFTLLGGLQWISATLLGYTGPGMLYQMGLLIAFSFVLGTIDLPIDYYKQFVLETRFGFNKMTRRLFFQDMVKHTLVNTAISLPLVWIILTLMQKAGAFWWIDAWVVFSIFMLFLQWVSPTLIAPLFNKFTPLTDESLRVRIENLMTRVGFASRGLFVMDGSKRSAHGNAYFSGFGAAKRVVFFDTLISRLAPQEVEAVLAHELGHFKLKHIAKSITILSLMSLGFFAIVGYLKSQPWFYQGLGVEPTLFAANDAMALILFMLVLPAFTFLLSPLASITSRKHEFEADAFAATHTEAQNLISALVKLYDDNASTLTPDPLHSAFYNSHPPASIRINRLLAA